MNEGVAQIERKADHLRADARTLKIYMQAKQYPSSTFDVYLEHAKASSGWSSFEFGCGTT
jgi:hypothetical protein